MAMGSYGGTGYYKARLDRTGCTLCPHPKGGHFGPPQEKSKCKELFCLCPGYRPADSRSLSPPPVRVAPGSNL